MVEETARRGWRRPLMLLMTVASGAALAWLRARRRAEAEPLPHSWSEPPKLAPAPEPVAPAAPAKKPAPAGTSAAEPGPYPSSVLPLEDGSPPSEEYVVKGNVGSMRSHTASSPYFRRTRAQVWFRTEEDAAAAGFRPWAPRK